MIPASHHAEHEALLRRSTHEDRPRCPSRHVQVRGRTPLWCQPLFGQALREDRQPLEPRKGGGPPKTDEITKKLLEEDVKDRPGATVSERRLFLERTGLAPKAALVCKMLSVIPLISTISGILSDF